MSCRDKLLMSLLITCSSATSAYEMPTHAFMTKNAFDRSVLAPANTEIYQRLGFDRLSADYPFNTQTNACDGYLDPVPNWLLTTIPAPDSGGVRFRCVTPYERRSMPLIYSGRPYTPNAEFPVPPGLSPHLRFEAWFMRGVIREDDLADKYYTSLDRPDIDPWADRTRVFNHFYSPVTNSTDSVVVDVSGVPSLGWALGEANPFAGAAQIPDPMRGNHFSYVDARRAFFLALTYREPIVPASISSAHAKLESDIRMQLWGTTLKSVGHVVHLMQDLASPQHSRGEPHNHTCTLPGSVINQDRATRTYENFINFRLVSKFNGRISDDSFLYVAANDCEEAQWLQLYRESGQVPANNINPWLAQYPVPSFAVQRKFFTTRAAGDSTNPATLPLATLNARAGLGDYANRGFYTQDNQVSTYQSPPGINSTEFVAAAEEPVVVPGLGTLRLATSFWRVPDPVAPNFADAGLDPNGRAPIVSQRQWCTITLQLGLQCNLQSVLTLRNYNQMADMLIPRATAYTAGMVNFFFRGKLEIEPITQNIFAVLNQGVAHTMVDGYPIKTGGGGIFGFEKIRLKVRNSTEAIVESGTSTNVPQIVGAGKLVAVARYHRNPCYKPDLTGERVQTVLAGPITEPTCPDGTRTDYQEISMSAELPIASETDLPGGRGGTAPATIEKTFDFSADPIPINATDLFIQVVYRGQLGEETDGIAVGNVDVREPSVVTVWSNYDYYLTSAAWTPATPARPLTVVQYFRFCIGPNGSERLAYQFTTTHTGNAMILGQSTRIAVIAPNFANVNQTFRVKATGITSNSPGPDVLLPPNWIRTSRGRYFQANKELISAATLAAPQTNCSTALPGTPEYLCVDPIQQRRGTHFGFALQPLAWQETTANGFNSLDVGNLPAFTTATIQVLGDVNFNNVGPLSNCPSTPVPVVEE